MFGDMHQRPEVEGLEALHRRADELRRAHRIFTIGVVLFVIAFVIGLYAAP